MKKKVKQVEGLTSNKKNKEQIAQELSSKHLPVVNLEEFKFLETEILKEQELRRDARNLLINNEKIILRLREKINHIENQKKALDLIVVEYEKSFLEWEQERKLLIQKEQKALSQADSCKQTISFRLGYAIVFGFKSYLGFKTMIKTIFQLLRERKTNRNKTLSLGYKELEKPIINTKSLSSIKPVMQWKNLIHEKAYQTKFKKYNFCEDGLSQTELLISKKGYFKSISCADYSQLVLHINVYVKNEMFSAKQALLTVDYFNANNERLEPTVDIAFSKAINKYYFYLDVNPKVADQILLVLPHGATRAEIGVLTWDAKSPVYIANAFHVGGLKDGVSVILPTYKGQNTILKCLESLAQQTLSYSLFEILVVVNGEQDETPKLLEDFKSKYIHLDVQVLILDSAGVSNARNTAIEAASRSYITFVDDDDFISPEYLKSLYSEALYNHIVLTGIEDVQCDVILRSAVQDQLQRASKKEEIDYFDVTSTLTMNACKLAPAHMVKKITYEVGLKSGEDVVFWTDVICQFAPKVKLVQDFDVAKYSRVLSDNSISRQLESYDFNVSQRLMVIQSLLRISERVNDIRLLNFIQSKINAQANFIQRYLKKNRFEYNKFIEDIKSLNIRNEFVSVVNKNFSKMLVISYCYTPYVDTSGVVMSKRIHEMKKPVDVISNSMDRVRRRDTSLNEIAFMYVGEHIELKAPQAFSNWGAIEKFSEMVVLEVGKKLSSRVPYEELYSRAMWPASHFAAAMIKIKDPTIYWKAEFSDPVLVDVSGNQRYEKLRTGWLEDHGFIELLNDKRVVNDNLFYWCEQLVYLLADEIIFTNSNQKEYMLSYIDEHVSRDSIEARAVVKEQPTLERSFYDLVKVENNHDINYFHLGYFGSFYVNRGFSPFVTAWEMLPKQIGQKIRLHIYTQQDAQSILETVPDSLKHCIEIKEYIDYFEFLKISDYFDALVVMDCITEGLKIKNPYLPSKLSDYLGSSAKILALVEKDSPMDNCNYNPQKFLKVELNNTEGICTQLKNLVNNKFMGLTIE